MSIESIESETMQQFVGESVFEEENKALWNGRSLCTSHVNSQIEEARKAVLLYPMSSENVKQEEKTTSIVTTQEYSEGKFHADVVLCGEKVDGEVSIRGSSDTDGNKSAEVEVEVSSKDGNVSGSVSGSVNQDTNGHTEGRVEGEVTIRF